jgi:hypothetical protein
MIFVVILVALMVISTVLVVAAGMLSSRLSRQEGRVEMFEVAEPTEGEMAPQSID